MVNKQLLDMILDWSYFWIHSPEEVAFSSLTFRNSYESVLIPSPSWLACPRTNPPAQQLPNFCWTYCCSGEVYSYVPASIRQLRPGSGNHADVSQAAWSWLTIDESSGLSDCESARLPRLQGTGMHELTIRVQVQWWKRYFHKQTSLGRKDEVVEAMLSYWLSDFVWCVGSWRS